MSDRQRKDRLIQTRVPQELESTLKDEARKRRLSVSHLIRNVLEDTFNLVDNVVIEVDRVVSGSVEMAKTLQRDAQRLAATARGETAHREPIVVASATVDSAGAGTGGMDPQGGTPERGDGPDLTQIYAWQQLVLNRPVECATCHAPLGRGERAHLGLTEQPGAPRVWLCQACLDTYDDAEAG